MLSIVTLQNRNLKFDNVTHSLGYPRIAAAPGPGCELHGQQEPLASHGRLYRGQCGGNTCLLDALFSRT